MIRPRNITSTQHPLVKHLVKLRVNRDYRYDHRTILIEGMTLVTELRSVNPFKVIVAIDEMLIPLGLQADEILIVSESVMKKISGVESPEGIIAEMSMPMPSSMLGKSYVLALDGVSDPGNLGTLIRSALALGWEGAYLLDGCCDPFNDKALRSSRGATFRLPLARGNWDNLQSLIFENQWTPIVADLSGVDVNESPTYEKILLVLGNESKGPSLTAKQVCHLMTIKMHGNIDSLNVGVAGSIMMYVLNRKKK